MKKLPILSKVALFRNACWLVLLLMITAGSLIAQTTEFTYQGKLNDGGVAVSTPRDLRFRLWDLDADGNQVGTDVAVANVTFSGGIFTVLLDFGQSAFTGEQRWIEVAVSLPGANDFTTLAPRQKVTSAPFAVQALNATNAETATTATDSLQLGGVSASEYVQTTDARMTDARTPLADSADYIQNQNAAPQTSSNFSVDGIGRANILSATTQFDLGGTRILAVPNNSLFAGIGAGGVNSTGSANSFFGLNAGASNTTGFSNTFVGFESGRSNTSGNWNSFVGLYAGLNNTTGIGNNFFGSETGTLNTTGTRNSFYGGSAGRFNTVGSSNSFFGEFAGVGNTTGNNNTTLGSYANLSSSGLSFATAVGSSAAVGSSDTIVIGKVAGTYNGLTRPADTVVVPGTLTVSGSLGASVVNAANRFTIGGGTALSFGSGIGNFNLNIAGNSPSSTGGGLTFVGHFTGTSNTSGTSNSFFGLNAGRLNTSGNSNSFFGRDTGFAGTTGSGNSAFGKGAGSLPFVGDNNTFIGLHADFANAVPVTGSNNTLLGTFTVVNSGVSGSTAVGYQARVTQNNAVVLGNTGVSVGIGTTAPKTKLDVTGGDILVGSPGQGIILKSPSGNTCVKLTVDDTPTFVGTVVPCP